MHTNTLSFELSRDVVELAWDTAQAANYAHTDLEGARIRLSVFERSEDVFADSPQIDSPGNNSLTEAARLVAEAKVRVAEANFNSLLAMAGVVTTLPHYPFSERTLAVPLSPAGLGRRRRAAELPEGFNFSNWLDSQLEIAGVSASDLALASGISEGYISALRTGRKKNPSPKTIALLARSFGTIRVLDNSDLLAELRTTFGSQFTEAKLVPYFPE